MPKPNIPYKGYCHYCGASMDKLAVLDVLAYKREIYLTRDGKIGWGDVYAEDEGALKKITEVLPEGERYFCDVCDAHFGPEDILIVPVTPEPEPVTPDWVPVIEYLVSTGTPFGTWRGSGVYQAFCSRECLLGFQVLQPGVQYYVGTLAYSTLAQGARCEQCHTPLKPA